MNKIPPVHQLPLARSVVAGVAATSAILLIIYKLPRVFGRKPVDLAAMAGSMTGVRDPAAARAIGLPAQYFNGTVFVMFYAMLVLASGRRSTVTRGAAFGSALWLLGSMLAMPALMSVHPRVRSGEMTNPGLFMRNWRNGGLQALVFLAGHLAFGAVAGAIYRRELTGKTRHSELLSPAS